MMIFKMIVASTLTIIMLTIGMKQLTVLRLNVNVARQVAKERDVAQQPHQAAEKDQGETRQRQPFTNIRRSS